MKRSGPLRRGAPLKRTRLAARSAKRADLYAEDRRPRIERIVASGVECLIGPLLAETGWGGCSGGVEGLHERRKRSAGGSLVNPENLIPACNACNGFIEDHPEVARGFGTALVVREGDEEWDSLGARADRFG